MRNDRGLTFDIGSKVKFQYPIPVQKDEDPFEFEKINEGIIERIDGHDIYIKTDVCVCHRYDNEILEILA